MSDSIANLAAPSPSNYSIELYMSVATVKAVASRFLKSEKPEVMALKGSWGVGKTYAWNKLVIDCKDDIKLSNYCYVSLFGISSISELKTAIFTKTQSVQRLGIKLDVKTINDQFSGILWEKFKNVYRNGSSILRELPYGKNITVGLESLAPHFIRDTIVCLDDFERLATGVGSIKPEEILGFISELKEEKGCKVILVFNEEKLSNKDIYSKYREKVVDIELLYDPTSEEAVEIALPEELPLREVVTKHCIALAVKNIRVLRKIVGYIELVHPEIKHLHPRVMAQAVQTIVLLAWCYFDTDDKKPTVVFLKEWNTFMWGFKLHNNEQIDPLHSAWNSMLQTYGISSMDEFDLAILRLIERGHLEETGFSKEAISLDAQFKAQELESSFTAAWNLFHNSFKDNQQELISTMHESFKKSVKHINPVNLNGTTNLLRQLGRGDLADELIDYYLDVRADEDGILDLENSHFSGDIRDPVIWERFEKRKAEKQSLMPLAEAVRYIAEHHGWDKIQIESLLAATENDFYKLFKQDHGRELGRVVSCCLQFEGFEPNLKPIWEKSRNALIRIGKEHPLNAIRIRRYKVQIDVEETSGGDQGTDTAPTK